MRKGEILIGVVLGIVLVFFGIFLATFVSKVGELTYPPYEEEISVKRAVGEPLLQALETGADYEPSLVERKIIRDGYISIEVESFDRASQRISEIAINAGGFVSDTSMTVSETGGKSGYVVVRVPEERFFSVISKLEEIGEVKMKQSSGRDVTEEYINLDARLNNLKKQEERYLEILNMAKTVDEVLKVENQLSRIRGEIESLQGRMNYLEDRIKLATLQVYLSEEEIVTHTWGIWDAINRAIEAFMATIRGIIVITGYLLPLLAVFGLLVLVLKLVRRSGK
ncbi:MAG: DUF4349 domain-containing protein [Candidatus Methanofastidiosia archaeon]